MKILNYPYKLEPLGDDILTNVNIPIDMKNNRIPEDKLIKHLSLVSCPGSGFHFFKCIKDILITMIG